MAGRILVLDDEENYAEMLQDLLRQNNYRVDMATRPERAIEQLEEIPYDLVISDYKMPVMDGADFLKKTRELYPSLPFIILSGLMNTPELIKVANMSVTLVLEKPLDTEVFLDYVSRFSDPQTEEEKQQLVQEAESASEAAAALSYPEEPRFFSASNLNSSRFLQSAWTVAKEGRELFIYESPGSDTGLSIKDLSNWRGNLDTPVEMIVLPDSDDEFVSRLRDLLSDVEKSRVVGVRLQDVADIARARNLTELVQRKLEDAGSLLLIYIVDSGSLIDFKSATAGKGLVNPRICQRPSDLAVYIRRFMRIAGERVVEKSCGDFTPEAVYALLSYDWPRNYKQIQEVLSAALKHSPGEPITIEVINEIIGVSIKPVAPDSRIAALMKAEQYRSFQDYMKHADLTVGELAKVLEFDSTDINNDDLKQMPLLRSEWGSF